MLPPGGGGGGGVVDKLEAIVDVGGVEDCIMRSKLSKRWVVVVRTVEGDQEAGV